jgi:hypothetical protein
MATATAIAIKAAQEAERQANALNEINDRLARIESILSPRDLPAAELVTSVQFATKEDVESVKTVILDSLLNAINAPTSNKPVAPKVGRPSSTG